MHSLRICCCQCIVLIQTVAFTDGAGGGCGSEEPGRQTCSGIAGRCDSGGAPETVEPASVCRCLMMRGESLLWSQKGTSADNHVSNLESGPGTEVECAMMHLPGPTCHFRCTHAQRCPRISIHVSWIATELDIADSPWQKGVLVQLAKIALEPCMKHQSDS